jgi:hypothetical protein
MIYRAIKGDFAFTKEILDRVHGKVKDAEPTFSPVKQSLDENAREDTAKSGNGDPARRVA